MLVFGKESNLEKIEHNVTAKTFLQYFGKFTNSLKNLVIFSETRKHSSMMSTSRLLTVVGVCVQGVYVCPGRCTL